MSEEVTQHEFDETEEYEQEGEPRNNKTVIIILVAVLVILAVVVGVLYLQRSKADTPTESQNVSDTQPHAEGSNSGTIEDTTEFDVATATKLPAGETPEQALEAYLTACDNGDWAKAYELLPLGKKESYGSAEAFGTQLESYGISGHTMEKVSENTDSDGNPQVVYTGTMKTSNGNFSNDWTFVEVGGQWYVKTRSPVRMN